MYHIERLTAPTAAQLRQVIALYRAENWWWQDEEHLDVADGIVTGSFCFLVAVNDGNIVGMGRAISDGISDAYIQDVTVRQDMRHHGIGSALLQALLHHLQQAGIDWIGLIAERGSYPLYEKQGFSAIHDAVPMLHLDNS